MDQCGLSKRNNRARVDGGLVWAKVGKSGTTGMDISFL